MSRIKNSRDRVEITRAVGQSTPHHRYCSPLVSSGQSRGEMVTATAHCINRAMDLQTVYPNQAHRDRITLHYDFLCYLSRHVVVLPELHSGTWFHSWCSLLPTASANSTAEHNSLLMFGVMPRRYRYESRRSQPAQSRHRHGQRVDSALDGAVYFGVPPLSVPESPRPFAANQCTPEQCTRAFPKVTGHASLSVRLYDEQSAECVRHWELVYRLTPRE